MDMIEALRLMAGRAPTATHEAVDAIEAIRRRSPMVQIRYNRTVGLAFGDPAATFSADERAAITAHLDASDSDARGQRIGIRVSAGEKAQIEARAAAAGLPVSDYLRRLALGDGEEG